MLQFYINLGDTLKARPPFSRPLTIKTCAGFHHEAVPLSRIYVTSHHYADLLKQSLGTRANALRQLPQHDAERLMAHARFPKNFRNLEFVSVTALHHELRRHSQRPEHPTFVLVNGIGTGLGDNFIGLGVLQRLQKLLTPLQAEFCMMQELEERIAPIYRHDPSISLRPCFMPLDDFLRYDYVIDYSTVEDMPSLDQVAAIEFNRHALSINKLLPNTDIQPRLNMDKVKTQTLRKTIHSKLLNSQSTVLLHPLASSSLRAMPTTKAAELVNALGARGYNVVSAFAHDNPPPHFLSLADHSQTLDDLMHIIDAVDAVVSVGTVVYHLASALGKPTLLLPTVHADIRSAALLPEVITWAPPANQSLFLNLHKSEEPADLKVAEKIWQNVNPNEVVDALDKHLDSCSPRAHRARVAPHARQRIGVVIPYHPSSDLLLACLDSLCGVEGFDPLYLYSVRSPDLSVKHGRYTDVFNQGIRQALADHCDCIWLLHENARVPDIYLKRMLRHFDHSKTLGIIGSADVGIEHLYGHIQLEPNYLTTTKQSDVGLRQPWLSFSSVLIRASVFNDIAGLDPSMQRLFCDIDFCIQAAEFGWETWHDPTQQVMFETHGQSTSQRQTNTLRQSADAFFSKWSTSLGVNHPKQIETALLDHIGF